MFQLPYNATAGTYSTPNSTATPAVGVTEDGIFSGIQLMVDSNSNAYITNATASGTVPHVYLIPNTGTYAAPTYTQLTGFSATTLPGYYAAMGIDGTGTATSTSNIWAASYQAISEITPTGTSASSTTTYSSFALPTTPNGVTGTTAASHPNNGEVDGGGNFWYPSTSASGSIYLQITPSAALYNSTTAANNVRTLRPCYVPAGGSACDATLLIGSPTPTQYYVTGDSHNFQVDSAGAIWASSGVSSTLTSASSSKSSARATLPGPCSTTASSAQNPSKPTLFHTSDGGLRVAVLFCSWHFEQPSHHRALPHAVTGVTCAPLPPKCYCQVHRRIPPSGPSESYRNACH